MIVRAKDTEENSMLEKGKMYIVFGCLYEINPQETKGGLQYIVEANNEGRRVPLPQKATQFEVIDSAVPSDWGCIEFDLKQRQSEAIMQFEQVGNVELAEQRKKLVQSWVRPYKTLVVSFPEMLEFSFFVALHDDSLDSEQVSVFGKYKQKYEDLYADYPRR